MIVYSNVITFFFFFVLQHVGGKLFFDKRDDSEFGKEMTIRLKHLY